MWLLLFFALIAVAYLIKYNYSRINLYLLAYKLPGPPAIPIFGNSLNFLCSNADALTIMRELIENFPKPSRVWLGPDLLIVFEDPVHLEKILLSTKFAQKHYVYEIMKTFLGNGLVSNSGPLWKYHRKIIQPLFNLKNLSGSLDYMKRHISTLMEKLDKHTNGEIFDVHDEVHYCIADLVTEVVLGMKMNFQSGQNANFLERVVESYSLCYGRMIRPWLHPDAIYKLTSDYISSCNYKTTSKLKMKKGIEDSWKRVNKEKAIDMENDFVPILDQLTSIIKDNPNCINEEDLISHVLTLYLASEDTITINAVFLILLFGMNPKYQQLAAEEIDTVVGNSCENIAFEDLQKLKYLDMCMKEVFRLMPIAPIILREATDDFKIDDIVIPKGCSIVLPIINTHRHPDHWEHPNEFYPNHFLPETVAKRHPYAFIPFSAGPRGCIGKYYAYGVLRLTMANILHRFEIEAEGTIHDIKLQADISVRSQNGYKIRLKRRNRTK